MIPSEMLVQERIQEFDREVEQLRLVHLAHNDETLAERLRRYGAALFGGDSRAKLTEHKN